jgi:hypothetical protein
VTQRRRRTQFTFSLIKTESDWEKRVLTLETIPPLFLAGLRALQPWASNLQSGDSLVGLLRGFDIIDNHRGLISGALHFQKRSTAGLDLNVQPADTIDDSNITVSTNKVPVCIREDATLMTVRSATHTSTQTRTP